MFSKSVRPRRTAISSTPAATAPSPSSGTSAGKPARSILSPSMNTPACGGEYVLRQVYPVERVLAKADGTWRWKSGERVRLRLDPFQLEVLFIGPAANWKETVPAGRDYERTQDGIALLELPDNIPWF